jgi:hypothetical protein
VWWEYSANAASLFPKHFDIEQILVDFSVHHPNVTALQPKHNINRVMKFVRTYKCNRSEFIGFVAEAFGGFCWQLALLILKL